MKDKFLPVLILLTILTISTFSTVTAQAPNILLVIADDLGVDYCNGYHNSNQLPTTPTLDGLRANGITFENVFSTPKCTPSRATIMSGKYGVKTGVLGTPGDLNTVHTSIFKAIEDETNGQYADAVIGKWHISQPADPSHPIAHGVDYYMGVLSAAVDDYYAWERTENGQTTIDSTYATTAFTDAAIDWVAEQTQPWFLWLAHVAPHAPFHVPPDGLFTIDNTENNRRKYVAMIEAMDHELGRLLSSLSPDVLQNTLVIFIGDNGTPNTVLQDYPDGHGKSTLYQGGIRVPMIASGAGVTRMGERESALVHITDIYATLLEAVGADLPGGVFNSLSFYHLLNDPATGDTRDYNYSEIEENGASGFTIRTDRYKLIESLDDGTQEFYDLLLDSLETTDLLPLGLDANQLTIKADLEQEAQQVRTAWSCRDYIQNGDEAGIDCGGTYCDPCAVTNTETILALDDINIYPNPTTDELHIRSSSTRFSVQLLDAFGSIHFQTTASQTQHLLQLSSLPPGIYFVKMVAGNGDMWVTEKIIKL
ncbi:MAG: sulfatase-like hydrolase/transferase [Bacteroidota bacterium]